MLRIRTVITEPHTGTDMEIEVVFEAPNAPADPQTAAAMVAEFERALIEERERARRRQMVGEEG